MAKRWIVHFCVHQINPLVHPLAHTWKNKCLVIGKKLCHMGTQWTPPGIKKFMMMGRSLCHLVTHWASLRITKCLVEDGI